MPGRDPDQYDFFVSYARKDNVKEWVTAFVGQLLDEHREFTGGRELSCFFDKKEILTGDDGEHTLHHGIAKVFRVIKFRQVCETTSVRPTGSRDPD